MKSARVIRSMTGFGAASLAENGLEARVEVRSVNHRHLQVKARLPSDASHLEPEIEALVRRSIERGAVTVTVALRREERASIAGVDLDVARGYQRMLGELATSLGLDQPVRLETILDLPGVVVPRDDGGSREEEQALIERCLEDALRTLVAMRTAEGKSLETDLVKNTHAIAKIVAKIEKRMPQAVKAHHRALQKRLSELLGRGQPVGRQLDFLVQELLREANTIGAKCNDAVTAHDVVELKTLIERLREQVQNVE